MRQEERGYAGLVRLLGSATCSTTTFSDGSGVVLDMAGMRALALNPTGMCVVAALTAGESGFDGIVAALTSRFQVDPLVARRDAAAFLDLLESALATSGDGTPG